MAKSLSKSFSKSIKSNGDFKKISHDMLHNRLVLYFIFIVAVGNLFHFVFSNDLMSVGVFIASGLLTSFFSKNMVVIMVVAMVVANIVRFSFLGREGFAKKKKEKWETAMEEMFSDAMNEAFEEENGDDDGDDGDDGDDDDDEESDKKKKKKSEEFTTRFEGFETKKKPSLEDQVKKLQKDVEQIKLDM
jgi:hypothetical protein